MSKYIDAEKLITLLVQRKEQLAQWTDKEYANQRIDEIDCILDVDIESLQQEAAEEEKERERVYRESSAAYWRYVQNTIDNKMVLPTFKGQLLHDFKNELHTMKQIIGLINHPEIPEGLFDKLALVFATWGGYYFHPNDPPAEDSIQQEQPEVDLVAELKHHLATTPKEQLEKEWKELEP